MDFEEEPVSDTEGLFPPWSDVIVAPSEALRITQDQSRRLRGSPRSWLAVEKWALRPSQCGREVWEIYAPGCARQVQENCG